MIFFWFNFRRMGVSKELFEKNKTLFTTLHKIQSCFKGSFLKDMTAMSNLLENGYFKGICAFEQRF